jgi:quinoprotein glucose dehydrogenase
LVIPLLLTGCWTTSYGVPAWQLTLYAFQLMGPVIWCGITGCPADLPEGVSQSTYDETLLTGTPVALDVDAWGRVYVAEGGRQSKGVEDNRFHEYWLEDDLASRTVEDRVAYYEKWIASGQIEDPDLFTRNADRILRFDDDDGDGVADSVHELARFQEMATGLAAGVLVEGRDVYATVIPEVVRLRDVDGDGSAERREVLARGFGVKTSLLGHDLHGLVWGPDGKLYFSMGDRGYSVTTKEGRLLEPPMDPGRGAVFRMNPDGSELEVFAHGVRNPQELAFDDHGNLFTGDNNGDGGDAARIVYVVEGGETGWSMPFQSLVGDYVRGPWMEERLWDLQHEGQPAWVLPPVAHIANGPAGFTHYPGIGLPERYANHFFLCDYAYTHTRSGIWSFALEPRGAGFEMVDRHEYIWSLLATDVTFGWDSRMYVSQFNQFGGGQSLEIFDSEARRDDPRIDEVEKLGQEGLGKRDAGELEELLGHADQRVRLRAQFELVRRREGGALAWVAEDPELPLVTRLHGIWGLGQLGADALLQAGWSDLGWLAGEELELRAQVAKLVGDVGADWLAEDLLDLLSDEALRVRFFAAQSLGALGVRQAVSPLFALIRENANRDVFLRHAAVYALSRIGDVAAIWAHADDPDPAVRLAVLLVARQHADPRIARFVSDADPFLVAEAARAIYDVPIAAAMPSLARLAGHPLPGRNAEAQTRNAIERRVIGAAVAVGTPESARALAAHVNVEESAMPMRELALAALANFTRPLPRDFSNGFYRPLPERDPAVVDLAFETHGRAMVEGDLGGAALKVALSYGKVPLDDPALQSRVAGSLYSLDERVASLQALETRGDAARATGVAAALASGEPALRAEARDLLAETDPAAALASIRDLPDDAPLVERQRAYGTLALLESPAVDALLGEALEGLIDGQLDPALELDVMDAVRRQGSPALVARLVEWDARRSDDPVALRSWALAGGDAERGEAVFQGHGDCLRCHGEKKGHGAGAGPSLAGLSERTGREYWLRSVVAPGDDVVMGFGTITLMRKDGTRLTGTLVDERGGYVDIVARGEVHRVPTPEIADRTSPVSSMPPMGLTLGPHDLRDLVAYLGTL